MGKTSFMPLSHLTALRAFEVASRRGSLKAAAIELYVTESAVSRLVRQLELAAGTYLFERKHRRLELTDIGREFAQELTPAFERIRYAGDVVGKRLQAKPLVVAAPATFLLRWLIPRQGRLQLEMPDTPIRLTTWDAPPNLDDHSISVFVGVGQRTSMSPSAVTIDLMQESFGLAVSPVLLRTGSGVEDVLASIPRLMPSTRPKIWEDWIQEGGRDAPHDSTQEFERMYFTLQAAEAAVGSVIAPLEVVADALEAGRLVTPFGRIARKGSYYLTVPSRIASNADTRKAIHWFMRECSATQEKVIQLAGAGPA